MTQLGVGEGDLSPYEFSLDPTRPEHLAQGGNFRLQTPAGVLDIMQWVPGIEADHAFEQLVAGAESAHAFGVEIKVCSLADPHAMKQAAGRPQDLQDLRDLDAAHADSD